MATVRGRDRRRDNLDTRQSGDLSLRLETTRRHRRKHRARGERQDIRSTDSKRRSFTILKRQVDTLAVQTPTQPAGHCIGKDWT